MQLVKKLLNGEAEKHSKLPPFTVPEYITAIIPNARANDIDRSLRNAKNILTQPYAQTTSYTTSFIPSATKQRNKLPTELSQLVNAKMFSKKKNRNKDPIKTKSIPHVWNQNR